MRSLKPSAIREIFRYAADPSYISLAAGSPAPEALPVKLAQRLMAQVLEEMPMTALQYNMSEGYAPLRQALRDYLSSRHNIIKAFDDLIITSGAQHAMDLTAKVLCDEGDTVICEEPSFIGSLNTFRSYGIKLAGVPMESDGIDIIRLEEKLYANPHAKFIYVIPNFQNPTGITMSLEKRKAVYALAKKYGTLILEDNPYGDLRFAGEALPSIKSMDEDGIVFYAGTFSKILSPGIRVGYLIAPEAIMGKIIVAKQCTDVHTNMLGQSLCHRFMTQCDVDAHISSLKSIYAHKCSLMLSEMEKHFPRTVTWAKPEGGLFIWADMGMDGAEIAARLVAEKRVCIVPGSAFSTDENTNTTTARFNFSTPPDDKIITAIGLAGELLREIVREGTIHN
ncbi:MAG: PLP-dependent aminotransferase family protein [Oscillospiraceae bacterium]|nr:PLP-dependent aminotransferase family protein [Oscillospiraceae bacterium]